VREKVKQFKLPFIYVNLVGGQDELIFDGNSFAMDANGRIAVHLPSFEEATTCCRLTDGISDHPFEEKDIDEDEELYSALKTGIRDYFYKSGFKDAVIGLSGGIDSALVAALAADALGPEHVYAYALPSRFSSGHSLTDAELCAGNLKIHYDTISIEPLYELFLRSLEKPFTGTVPGITEENLQARIRGTILMSIANKKNALLLTTGNKTELVLGYCTMYGDMCGALAPISDMNKLEVYCLSRYINRLYAYDLIPESTLSKIPSAELAEGQYDPFDYDVISPLVDDLLESDKSLDQIMADAGDPELVARVYELIRINEYKRWQAAPGLKVSAKAFGQGRRMPLVNHFKIKDHPGD
jgi:NAD+ synthase (glutamine-hydrolysing)